MRRIFLCVLGLGLIVVAGCSGEGRAQLVEEDAAAQADGLGDALVTTGKSIKLLFDFETAGTAQSGGKGVLIDDIANTAACAP